MIEIGKILINPDSIDTIVRLEPKTIDREKGVDTVQIVYKSGVVKNFSTKELGLSYTDFIKEFLASTAKSEDKKLLRVMAAIQSKQ